MPESVNTYRYLSYLRSRWQFIVGPAAVAAAIVLVVTLLEPKLYTATSGILIEPPAGTDIRGALGITPIYLESLRSYEFFASSDSLFVQAIDKFQLRRRYPHRTIESLKERILKVGMERDTKILWIAVELPDAKTAHAMALYLAEETVKLSGIVDQEGERPATPSALPQYFIRPEYRGERLRIIDPGIVPERPSSPHIFSRLIAAVVLGLVAGVIYLTFELSYRTQRAYAARDTEETPAERHA